MNELNDRDRQVLLLVMRRASIREIARDLHVGIGTVQKHLARLKGAGLMTSPEARLARMREVTQKGYDVLRHEGLLQ